jgi:hypothetical protein
MRPLLHPDSRLLLPWAIPQRLLRSRLDSTPQRHPTTRRLLLVERTLRRVQRSRRQVQRSPLRRRPFRRQARHSRLLLRRSRLHRQPFLRRRQRSHLRLLPSHLPVPLTALHLRRTARQVQPTRPRVHRQWRTPVHTLRQVQPTLLPVLSTLRHLPATEVLEPTGSRVKPVLDGLALAATRLVTRGGSGHCSLRFLVTFFLGLATPG